jgi:hypothetical protein
MAVACAALAAFAAPEARAQNEFGGNAPECMPGNFTKPAATQHVLKHPLVTLIFWGDKWPNPHINEGLGSEVNAGSITGALHHVFDGPYFSWLNQYYNAGSPRLNPSVLYKNNETAPASFSTSQVLNLVKSQLGVTVPQASANLDNIYLVITPPGSVFANGASDTCHSSAGRPPGCHPHAIAPNGSTFYYAWATTDEFLFSSTETAIHEVVESITDPDGSWGLGGVTGSNGSEISDVCVDCDEWAFPGSQGNGFFPWYIYPSYYSVADHRCIAPYTWQQTDRYFPPNEPGCNGQQKCWGAVTTDNHAVYAGGLNASQHGFVHTRDDGVWFHSSDQFSDQLLTSGGFATVAVSDRAIYVLWQNESALFQWKPATGWAVVGGAFTEIYAGGKGLVAVTAIDLAAGTPSRSMYLDDSTNTWTEFDSVPVSGFAVGSSYIFELDTLRNEVWRWGGSWQLASTQPTVDIAASNFLMARIQANPRDTYVWNGGSTWVHQKAGDPYAIATIGSKLFWMQPDRMKIFQSDNTGATDPHFTDVGWGGYMVRGATSNLFAHAFWTTD